MRLVPKLRSDLPDTLQVRVEPDLHDGVRRLAEGRGMTKSEMTRALIRRGVRSLADDRPPPAASPLGRDVVAARVEYLVELLDSLAHDVGAADPAAAALLLRRVSHAAAANAVDWELRS